MHVWKKPVYTHYIWLTIGTSFTRTIKQTFVHFNIYYFYGKRPKKQAILAYTLRLPLAGNKIQQQALEQGWLDKEPCQDPQIGLGDMTSNQYHNYLNTFSNYSSIVKSS